ncbi:hypothetical protein MMC14_009740 [Varicellaria rhodocarpa]|nr:hypothetical protein [Varicellaria rhodocarpa]
METIFQENRDGITKISLAKSIVDVQIIIDILSKARDKIASNPYEAQESLARLQNRVERSFEVVGKDLTEVYGVINRHSKTLDKQFKDKSLPPTDYDALSSKHALIDRAIGMHFLREGQFAVASAFLTETSPDPLQDMRPARGLHAQASMGNGLGVEPLSSEALRRQFASMYHILEEMRNERNLMPAIQWANENSAELEARGSNLEFELERLQFVWLFTGGPGGMHLDLFACQQRALEYARNEFCRFQGRYLRDIQRLIGAVAFGKNIVESPYQQIFCNQGAWEELATSFTREFCSLLGLSADSPLYIAATAGAISLPTLQKLQTIMRVKRTEWTSQHELPVEVPLPSSYRFHSIFVCPVSKEQTTDENPPMMMPCGHVIARESLNRLSKGSRFKCPYCPGESHQRDAKKVFL